MLDDQRHPSYAPRTRPLALQIGLEMVVLLADDVNLLLDSVTKVVAATYESLKRADASRALDVSQRAVDELEGLGVALATAAERFSDPPLEIDADRARLLRNLLSDISGYQRQELTPALHDLRDRLSA